MCLWYLVTEILWLIWWYNHDYLTRNRYIEAIDESVKDCTFSLSYRWLNACSNITRSIFHSKQHGYYIDVCSYILIYWCSLSDNHFTKYRYAVYMILDTFRQYDHISCIVHFMEYTSRSSLLKVIMYQKNWTFMMLLSESDFDSYLVLYIKWK